MNQNTINQAVELAATLALDVVERGAPDHVREHLARLGAGTEWTRVVLVAYDAAAENERRTEPQTESTYWTAMRAVLTHLYGEVVAAAALEEMK